MAESAALLMDEVFPKVPVRQWVLSFPFQLRFLLARHPDLMGKVLSIVYRTLSTHLIKKAGYTKASAQTGSVTLIQRFGSALNLNVHYHMLLLDGVYAEDDYGKQRFHRVKAPTHDELNTLAHTLSHRIARCLEKRGLLERDTESTWLTLEEGEDDVLTQLHGASVTSATAPALLYLLRPYSRIESPRDHSGDARSSLCKPCQDERIRLMLAVARPTMRDFLYTPV